MLDVSTHWYWSDTQSRTTILWATIAEFVEQNVHIPV
jgi:hypothetical protein